MKKNMLAVLIMLLTVVNLTLTAYMIFTVVPNAKRTDDLITKILQVIDLELESPLPSDINVSYSITDVEKYELSEMTVNLRTDTDGKSHFAKVTASLTINKAHEDYKTLQPYVDVMKSDISTIVMTRVSEHTVNELNQAGAVNEIKEAILADIQALFNSKFIVDCTVSYLIQ